MLRTLALARAAAVGDRRFAHQAIRAEGRRGRRPSQPHAGPGRPDVSCTDTSGSRSRWPCGIRGGVRWRCRCGPCSTSVRRRWPRFPQRRGWTFRHQARTGRATLVEWIVPLVKKAGKTLWVVVDGGYTKRPFLRRALRAGVTVVGRLRKDAALRDLPPKLQARPAAWSRPAAQVRQEQDQPGQAGRTPTGLADRRLHGLRQDGHQDVQDVPGDLSAGRRRDSRGAGRRRIMAGIAFF